MKRIAVIGVLLLTAGFLAWLAYLFWPNTVDIEAQGMKYRLGTPGAPEERLLNVRIKGTIYRENFMGDRRFHGTIELEGEEIPVPAAYRKTDFVRPRGFEYYFIFFHYVDRLGRLQNVHLGLLFLDEDAGRVAIAMYEPEEDGAGWNSDTGLMVAAPASNREEAVALSNELMQRYLGGYVLE
jgi:hypothetical protein